MNAESITELQVQKEAAAQSKSLIGVRVVFVPSLSVASYDQGYRQNKVIQVSRSRD
jgi:hypothetical protein